MAGPITLRNAVDTWTNGTTGYTTRNYGTTPAMRIRTTLGDHRAWIFFSIPFPRGATIQSAVLRLYTRETWAAGSTVIAQRTAAKWSANTITHANQPGVTGATATSPVVSGAAVKEVAIDVTAIMQAVANGGAWYGLRLTSAGADKTVYSAQSTATRYRPSLTLTWIDAPKAPTVMAPTANHAITPAKPILSFNYIDPSADSPLANVQVQIDTAANWSAPGFDSGTVASSVPQLDLTATAYAGLALAASTYWRVRVQDSGGLWSPWSHTVNGTGNQFQRLAKGTVTITNPAASPNNFVWDASPPITWTVAGMTQKHYQVLIVDPAASAVALWNSGKITSAALTATPTLAVLKDTGKTYRAIVRAWDTVERETNSGDPAYSESSVDFTYNYDAAVTAPTGLAAVQASSSVPSVVLTWSRTTMPDFWTVLRDGIVVARLTGAEAFVSGTSYTYTDREVTGRTAHVYSVMAVVNARQSASNPTANITVDILFPWLMRTDGTDAIALVGKGQRPNWSMELQSNQELQEVLGNYPPIVITQSLGGFAGHVEGMLAPDIITGVTSKQLKDRLKSIRDDPGIELILLLANETMRVAIYNVTWAPDTAPGRVDYWASFDYVQVVY